MELVYAGDVWAHFCIPVRHWLYLDPKIKADRRYYGSTAGAGVFEPYVCGASVYQDGCAGDGGRLYSGILFGEKEASFIWRDCLVSIRQLDPVSGIWHDQYCSFRILAGTDSESMEEQRLEDIFCERLSALRVGICIGVRKYCSGKCTGLHTGKCRSSL